MSLVLKVASRNMRGRAVSIYRSGFLIGGVTGPALGGAVLCISLRAPFLLYAGTLTLAAAVVVLFVIRGEVEKANEEHNLCVTYDDGAAQHTQRPLTCM